MAKIDAQETPMMRQFREIKNQYPDAVLLFRCGDFYETYAEDAVRASKILNITLTHRSNGASKEAKALEMAGFPFHALDTYLPKLVRAGLRVAICDQLEDQETGQTRCNRVSDTRRQLFRNDPTTTRKHMARLHTMGQTNSRRCLHGYIHWRIPRSRRHG